MPAEVFRTRNGVTGTPTYLGVNNWNKHVEKRPMLAGREGQVKRAVEDADIVYKDEDGVMYKYTYGERVGLSRDLYFLVIERNFNSPDDCIVTAFAVEHIKAARHLLRVRLRGGG